jgi:NAD(P)-dependent dehydrogenase (short-subunit alcohol dehydrogenase family)
MKQFEGRVALVTGGSSGLGKATALQFAREGAKVVIAARRTEQGEAIVSSITALGAEAHFVRTDVSRAMDVEAMVNAALDKFGRLDYAVNNAGVVGPMFTPVAEVTEDQWDYLMGINLRGVWLCMKHEIPAMLAQGQGAIVNVSSIYGSKPSEIGHTPYCVSKFGVIGLTKSAAVDYARAGIRINAVAPGFTRSEMVNPDESGDSEYFKVLCEKHSAMGRLGEAEEVANAIIWLCSDGARFVNGATLTIDGGDTTRLY